MKPVKAIDAAFLHLETPETPMHVGALFVLEPPPRRRGKTFHEAFTDVIRTRLGMSEVFTRKLARVPLDIANPMWVTEGDVDLEHHVRRTVLPKPGSMRDLEECVAELHTPTLDRDRPLWELHVIEGLAGGRAALYVKTHHAGLDGASAQVYLKSFVDLAPDAKRERVKAPAGETVHMARVVTAALRHQAEEYRKLPALAGRVARAAVDAISTRPGLIAPDASKATPRPRTPFNVAVSGERSFATLEIGLAEMKAVAGTNGATINDVILSITAGAARRWLEARAALPGEPLLAAVPVSTREPGVEEHSIQVSFMNVNLHTDVADPRSRLAAIHDSALESKGLASRMKSLMPEDLPSVGLPWLFAGAARALAYPALVKRLPVPANLLISNVAGPPMPLYVAGARALTYTPVSIPFHGMAFNATVYSYDGRLFFGLTGCRRAVPDIHDIALSITDEFHLLQRGARRRSAGRRQAKR